MFGPSARRVGGPRGGEGIRRPIRPGPGAVLHEVLPPQEVRKPPPFEPTGEKGTVSASAQRVYRRGGEVRSPSPHRGEGRGEGLRGGLERGISFSGSGETISVRPDPDGAMSLH